MHPARFPGTVVFARHYTNGKQGKCGDGLAKHFLSRADVEDVVESADEAGDSGTGENPEELFHHGQEIFGNAKTVDSRKRSCFWKSSSSASDNWLAAISVPLTFTEAVNICV